VSQTAHGIWPKLKLGEYKACFSAMNCLPEKTNQVVIYNKKDRIFYVSTDLKKYTVLDYTFLPPS
jgi:hypothetical protein